MALGCKAIGLGLQNRSKTGLGRGQTWTSVVRFGNYATKNLLAVGNGAQTSKSGVGGGTALRDKV